MCGFPHDSFKKKRQNHSVRNRAELVAHASLESKVS